jgi:hypothetical protein
MILHNLPYPGGWFASIAYKLLRGRDFLENKRSEAKTHYHESTSADAFDEVSYSVDDYALEEYRKLFKGIDRFAGVNAFLHGSRADGSETAFSDFDDLVVLPNEWYEKPRKLRHLVKYLNRIDMRFCRRDPLQHHGHWIIDQESLSRYDESVMPSVVLKDAKRICGNSLITFCVDRETSQPDDHISSPAMANK